MCNNYKPASRGIRNRSKPNSELTYLNPKTRQTHSLRYSVNQTSFFVDKQKGDVIVSPILVKDGTLRTTKNDIPLQKFLAIHPDNKANGGSIFEEYDPAKEATAEIEKEEIFVKSDYKIVRVLINDIWYIESANEYIKIYINEKDSITTLMRLKNFEEQLPEKKFMRIHRSFIVNLDKITAIDRNRIYINQKIVIPVGEQYKEIFQNYLEKKHFQSGNKNL